MSYRLSPRSPQSQATTRGQRRLLSVLWGDRSGRIGIVLVLAVVLVAVIGPFVAPYSPTKIGLAPSGSNPNASHLLGTDGLGRDVLSRLLHGGRSLVVLSVVAAVVSFVFGAGVGMFSGYKGGVTDIAITRVIDVGLSLPPLLLVMLFLMSLGTGAVVLIGVIAVFFAPRVARVIRGATLAVCKEEYILSARARGERTSAIILRELLPNISGPLLAEFALRFAYTIVFISTLNFLGLGVQPPSPDWGLMVSEGRTFLSLTPASVIAPAVGIAVLAIGASLVGDSLATHFSRASSHAIRI